MIARQQHYKRVVSDVRSGSISGEPAITAVQRSARKPCILFHGRLSGWRFHANDFVVRSLWFRQSGP